MSSDKGLGEEYLANHAFPDCSDFLSALREEESVQFSNWTPVDLSSLPSVDLDDVFNREIQKPVKHSELFDYNFSFDRKSGVAKSFTATVKKSPGTFNSSLNDLSERLTKVECLGINETFAEIPTKVRDLPLPDDLLKFVGTEFPSDVPLDLTNASTLNSKTIDISLSSKRRSSAGTVNEKKQEFEFARLLKRTSDDPYWPKERVIVYPFELDFFQRAAIVCLENREHVFVAAHTSAGKTVVAEWAIMLAVNNHRKAIYTSPIKALSNQKFRDFKQKFVGNSAYPNFSNGILTGDVQIDPDSSCLIMTTEILRSMLYLNSSIISEVDFVIFDEVHYISDEERGVVWEETLIMLPPSVTIVMLSATVGNAMQFANWIGGIKKRLVNVVFTAERPVPLTHHLYTGFKAKGKKEPELIPFLTHEKTVNETVVRSAEMTMKENRDSGVSKHEKLFKLLSKLKRDSLLPVIVFVFSKKQIEELATRMKGDFTSDKSEKWHIECFIRRKLETVKADYVQYSQQVVQLKALLARGIGVHHSGILPILKEIVELLFANGFVKVLFATETFAMGVNMPAKSVIFTAVNKFGNIDNSAKLGRRLLRPDEYIQMAGRAGRRGLDSTGTVVIFCDRQVPHSQDLRSLTTTKLASLRSHFQVTYSMILKIFRSESQLNIEDMMGRSFSEIRRIVHHEKSLVEAATLEQDLGKNSSLSLTECVHCNDADLEKFVLSSNDYFETLQEIYGTFKSKLYDESIRIGQLVVMNWPGFENQLGVVLQIFKDSTLRVLTSIDSDKCASENFTAPPIVAGTNSQPLFGETPYFSTKCVTPSLVCCNLQHLSYVTRKSINLEASQVSEIVTNFEQRARYTKIPFPFARTVYKTLEHLAEEVKNWVPKVMHSVDANSLFPLKAKSLRVHDLKTKFEAAESYLHAFCSNCEKFYDHVNDFKVRLSKQDELRKLKANLSHESLQHYQDYQDRRDILKRSDYLNSNDKLTLKGKVACQISIQEIMITESVFANIFHELTAPEIAGFLSVFVFQGPPSEEQDVETFVENVRLKEVILDFFKLKSNLMLESQIKDFGIVGYGDICVNLADTVFLFSSKASYTEIIHSVVKLEELGAKPVLEGDIVRCLQRVEYLVRELLAAAFLIGDPNLVEKFGEVHVTFKNELVFVNSLYLQN